MEILVEEINVKRVDAPVTFEVVELKKIELDVIGIDEAHFFDDLYDFCCKEADHDGKIVVVAVLDGDYLRKGLKSVVLERSDKLRTTGATIFIHSDRNALDQLGIGAQLGKLN